MRTLIKSYLIGIAVLLTGLALPASVLAQTQDRYAAIAFSQQTNRWGAGWQFSTQSAAESRAISECGQPDARVVVVTRNGYIALATGDKRGASGFAWASTPSRAAERALAECSARTTNCRVVVLVSAKDGRLATPEPPVVIPTTGRVQIVLVGLTNDPALGKMIEVNLTRLRATLRTTPGLREQDITELRGNQVTAANILSTVDHMNVGPEQTLFVYYLGHGGYDPTRARPGDTSGGHFFQIQGGDLMRKTLLDHMTARQARLTVLVTDTCNVRAVANPQIYQEWRPPTGENRVLRDLLERHRGVVDVSGSSRDQFGWYSADSGGWFTMSFVNTCYPSQFSGESFVTWDSFLGKVSEATSREYHNRKAAILRSPGTTAPTVLTGLRGQSDQRPQVFVWDVQRIR